MNVNALALTFLLVMVYLILGSNRRNAVGAMLAMAAFVPLGQEITLLGLADAVFRPETGEIFDFYRMADIFVCTSFEESFPRVLLESAAFRLPIVTTNVNGIPEMLAADEAWLIPPGDRHQLGEAIKQALAAHFAGDFHRAEKARASIVRRFHEANSLPLHLALAREAVASPRP